MKYLLSKYLKFMRNNKNKATLSLPISLETVLLLSLISSDFFRINCFAKFVSNKNICSTYIA